MWTYSFVNKGINPQSPPPNKRKRIAMSSAYWELRSSQISLCCYLSVIVPWVPGTWRSGWWACASDYEGRAVASFPHSFQNDTGNPHVWVMRSGSSMSPLPHLDSSLSYFLCPRNVALLWLFQICHVPSHPVSLQLPFPLPRVVLAGPLLDHIFITGGQKEPGQQVHAWPK